MSAEPDNEVYEEVDGQPTVSLVSIMIDLKRVLQDFGYTHFVGPCGGLNNRVSQITKIDFYI